MKDLKDLILEKLHLTSDAVKGSKVNTVFKTSEEVANFIHNAIPGSKMKKVMDHGYSSAQFKNYSDHGAAAYGNDVYEVMMPDGKNKIKVGICYMKRKINDRRESKNSIGGINVGDIIFETASKSSSASGRSSMSWNSDCLSGYEPGTDFIRFIEIASTGHYLTRFLKQYNIIDD